MGDFDKGIKLLNEKRFQEAEREFSSFLEREPYHIEALCNRAMAFRFTDRHNRSLQDFDAAINLAPNAADIYSERGVTYFHLKQLAEALEDFDAAVRLQPENPYRYSSRAYIKGVMGDTQGAIDDYKRAIELDPQDMVAYNNLGLLEEKLGHMDAAKRYTQKADELAAKQDRTDYSALKDQTKTEDKHPHDLPPIGKKPKKAEVAEDGNADKEPRISDYFREMRRMLTSKEGFKDYLNFLRKKLGR